MPASSIGPRAGDKASLDHLATLKIVLHVAGSCRSSTSGPRTLMWSCCGGCRQ